MTIAVIALIIIVVAIVFVRHQNRLKQRAYLMQEAMRNRDFTFRLTTRGMMLFFIHISSLASDIEVHRHLQDFKSFAQGDSSGLAVRFLISAPSSEPCYNPRGPRQ